VVKTFIRSFADAFEKDVIVAVVKSMAFNSLDNINIILSMGYIDQVNYLLRMIIISNK
jgi:hypothetical protein